MYIKKHERAVIRFKRREMVRKHIGMILLNVVIWIAVISPFFDTRTILIENVSADVSLVQAGDSASTIGAAQKVVGDGNRPLSPADIRQAILDTFGDDGEDMLKIAKCESNFNPKALGDQNLTYTVDGKQYGTSHGIFQIRSLPGRPEPSQLEDARFNIEYAKQILDRQGKYAWSYCYRHAVLKEI